VKRAHRLVLAGVKLGGQVRRVGQTTIPLSCQGIPDAGGRDRLHWVEGCRALAATVSCGQDIAGDGAFSLAMIADYIDSLTTYGAAFYRNLFWEAGMLGQVLYLEAEEAGIRSTGIGCYFDDPVHEAFGIASREWQSFYHFTVGRSRTHGSLRYLHTTLRNRWVARHQGAPVSGAGAGPSRGTDGENNVRPRRCVRCRTSEALPLCLYCRRVALSQLPSRDALQPGSSPRVRISRSCHQGGPL
jgi:hypothetical protein